MQIKTRTSILAQAVVESLEERRLLSTFTVTNTNDSGGGSLRQAINDANNRVGPDTIKFAIGSGGKTIMVKSMLPSLGDGTTLDATTQPGYSGKPIIELNGAGAGGLVPDGLRITGTGVTVKGLIINRFGGSGILILKKGGNTIVGNYIGTDRNGAVAASNKAHGILVQAPNNTIKNNLISGNGLAGVFMYTSAASGNKLLGNKIGTDFAGNYKIGNVNCGVLIGSGYNVIGGLNASDRNIISGNLHDGILIASSGARMNAIQGNYIGVDVTGTKRLGNGHYGIEVQQPDNVIGGSALGAGNVVSANVFGGVVLYLKSAVGNRVQGNFIGTDKTGTKDLGNTGRGVEATNGASHNLIGGPRASQRNIISGNDNGGIGIYSGATGNVIQKNFIGTDITGKLALGNSGAGIILTDNAGGTIIGGRGAGNVISANKQGIALDKGTGACVIHGNYIGTDITASKDLGNQTDGMFVRSSGNQIGGKKPGSGNLISGNNGDGIRVDSAHANLFRLNVIGLGAGGMALGNSLSGMVLYNANDNAIGANTIARNGGDGIKVSTGWRNIIVSNSIYSNGSMGIRVGSAGKQSGPSISSIKLVNGKYVVTGTVWSKANSTLYLELFGTTGDGEGKHLIATGSVTTNGSGQGTWTITVNKLNPGTQLTATATASDGSTSEFAAGKVA